MGGQIAMALCENYPARVYGLLLAATFPRLDSEATNELIGRMIAPANVQALPSVRK